MSNEGSAHGPGDPSGLPETPSAGSGTRAGEDATGISEQATERNLEQALREDLSEGRQFAKQQTEQVKTAVSRTAEGEKNLAARQLNGVGAAIEKVGSELEASDQRALGRYARQMGRSLQDYARDIEDRDLGEIAAMAEDFGRRQPLAFLGMAAIAGLTASRFLLASAERRTSRGASLQPSRSPSPGQPGRQKEEFRNG